MRHKLKDSNRPQGWLTKGMLFINVKDLVAMINLGDNLKNQTAMRTKPGHFWAKKNIL